MKRVVVVVPDANQLLGDIGLHRSYFKTNSIRYLPMKLCHSLILLKYSVRIAGGGKPCHRQEEKQPTPSLHYHYPCFDRPFHGFLRNFFFCFFPLWVCFLHWTLYQWPLESHLSPDLSADAFCFRQAFCLNGPCGFFGVVRLALH